MEMKDYIVSYTQTTLQSNKKYLATHTKYDQAICLHVFTRWLYWLACSPTHGTVRIVEKWEITRWRSRVCKYCHWRLEFLAVKHWSNFLYWFWFCQWLSSLRGMRSSPTPPPHLDRAVNSLHLSTTVRMKRIHPSVCLWYRKRKKEKYKYWIPELTVRWKVINRALEQIGITVNWDAETS